MRAYQLHTTTALADCCSLIPVSIRFRTTFQMDTGRATSTGAERYAVPHSPGRARRFCPYLPGRRRGRR
ncbi:MAG TPA: hypothetical protein VNG51_04715 [Ktedonobacteraceae bacterium]|nr:hypothetical protein [Ktedonobacteraceae bacterium]